MLAEFLDCASFHQTDCLALQIVVPQYQLGDLIGRSRQQSIAPSARDWRPVLGRIEQDLEIDLDVGGIDAGRIINEIGIGAPAVCRVLDTPALREALSCWFGAPR